MNLLPLFAKLFHFLFDRKEQKQPRFTLPLGYTRDGKLFCLTDTDAEKHIWLQGVSGSDQSPVHAVTRAGALE